MYVYVYLFIYTHTLERNLTISPSLILASLLILNYMNRLRVSCHTCLHLKQLYARYYTEHPRTIHAARLIWHSENFLNSEFQNI